MKRSDLEILYGLWGEESWPTGKVKASWRHFCEIVSPDTVFHSWDHAIIGGDPLTLLAVLRRVARKGGTVLCVLPPFGVQTVLPWLRTPNGRARLCAITGWEDDVVASYHAAFVQVVQQIKEHGGIVQSRHRALVHLRDDAHLVLRPGTPDVGVVDAQDWASWYKTLSGVYREMPMLDHRPALIGGQVGCVWNLGMESFGDFKKLEDYPLCFYEGQPISEAEGLWYARFEALWRPASKREDET